MCPPLADNFYLLDCHASLALARNDTAGAVKQNRAVREGCGKDASPQATQTQKTTSLRATYVAWQSS